jgi:predicted DCC family thiol-disulfide oxidoreductase YuxK
VALQVYTDGACPFCRWVRAKVEPYDTRGELRFLDYNDPQVAAGAPYSLPELDREMHVLTPDGRWSAGFFAWTEVLKVLPAWRWLGALCAVAPLRWIGPPLYRLIARNRDHIPGLPKPCDESCRVELR